MSNTAVAIGDVKRERQQRVAVLLLEVVERARIASGAGDAVAALQGRGRPFEAETA